MSEQQRLVAPLFFVPLLATLLAGCEAATGYPIFDRPALDTDSLPPT